MTIDVKSYTRLLRSTIFRDLILDTQANQLNNVHAIDDSTIIGAAKAHYIRKGGELVINHMLTRMTEERENQLKDSDVEPDFGAEEIIRQTLNPGSEP